MLTVHRALPSRLAPARPRRAPPRGRLRGPTAPTASAQQHVPSDSFGGRSPERVAADALRSLFTFAAAKIVLAQLEGSGRGGLASYDRGVTAALTAALETYSAPPPPDAPAPPPGLTRADVWLTHLARTHRGAALRVMEVRAEYAASDFEFESLARLCPAGLRDANTAIMRALATDALAAGVVEGEGGA